MSELTSYFSATITTLPIWAVFLILLFIVGVPLWIGRKIGQRRFSKYGRIDDRAMTMPTSALLSLLAFILGFTFSMAATRFEERRHVILDEANAIGTAYLRTDLIPEPARSEARHLLRTYAEMRLDAVQSGEISRFFEVQEQSTEIQNKLWAAATALATKAPSPITGMYISSLNDVIDLGTKRIVFGLKSSLPMTIWITLFVVAAIALGPAGYMTSTVSKPPKITVLGLVIALSGVLALIADLDNPARGMLRNNLYPMIELVASMSTP